MATSTITEPGCIVERSSRRTRRGAFAPGISTPPTTRSAVLICSRMLWRVELVGCPVPGPPPLGEGKRSGGKVRKNHLSPPPPPPLPPLLPSQPPPRQTPP